MKKPAGLEAVRMGGDAAHGMHGDGAADHLVVPAACPVGPGNVELQLLTEGHMSEFRRYALDRFGSNAAPAGNICRSIFIVKKAPGDQLKGGPRDAAIRQCGLTNETRCDLGKLCIE